MIISEDQLAAALGELAETDVAAAELKAAARRAEFKADLIKNKVFLIEQGSVADRKARSEIHDSYVAAMDEFFKADQKADELRNKRATDIVIIDAWRSLNSGRNKGNIT